ncbi:XdhC family protein [Caldimonas brevitalea]|uniref:Lipoprotein n=1 Tax=Caldimonas brevitalea TaxID=413882 RepID=A0A0G3BL13_9BURK|nr:XdhC family protein [Caldimonas brevitalea]AKJ28056.1 lipoprotein [Caldimonas brevitalea]
MHSTDLEVLGHAARWRADGHAVLLVTVVKTWGSSPRPEGAMLALRGDGRVAGSVSGGCIEDDLIARVQVHGIPATRPEVVTYGVSAEEARRFGLPCGGTIQLVCEPLHEGSAVEALLEAARERRLVARRLDLASGEVALEEADRSAGLRFDGRELLTVHGPRFRLLVIGAGQLSKFLCQIALALDFEVIVCDPREEYRDSWDVPGVQLSRSMPDDLVIELQPDERTAVVALTHDPKLDDLALMEALRSRAFYVAALGSRRNNDARRERLMEHFGLAPAELGRLHGPAGVYIGSKTPPEIAVSIAAEMIAAKNGVAAAADIAAAKGGAAHTGSAGCSAAPAAPPLWS